MTMVVSFNIKVSSRDEILTRLLAPSIRWLESPTPAPADVQILFLPAIILKLQLLKIKHIPSLQIQKHKLLNFTSPSIYAMY